METEHGFGQWFTEDIFRKLINVRLSIYITAMSENSENLHLLGEQIAEDVAHMDAAHHRVLTKIRVFDECGGWFKQGFRTCAQWLSWRVGWGTGTAREHVRVATALGSLPAIDAALERGELSYSKVRALTRVATAANEAVLLEQAKLTTGHQLETICRKYASVLEHDAQPTPKDDIDRRFVSRRDREDGMVSIEAVLHPEEAALVWAALERVAVERCSAGACAHEVNDGGQHVPASTRRPRPAFDRADALVHVAQQITRGDNLDRSPVELVVSVPIEALEDANHADPVNVACCRDGSVLSSSAARRLACDAGVVAMTENERGDVLSVGRKRRTIPASIKRALLRRDQTCRYPGCRSRVFLEGHHIEHWADGGETKLRNLVSICGYHHRFVHEYGFAIELRSDNTVSVTDPYGAEVPEYAQRPRPTDLGWRNIERRNAHLGITPDTIECWDGMKFDYGLCVEAILCADEAPA